MNKNTTIRGMTHMIRKWWLLQNVHRTIRYWTLRQNEDQILSGRRVHINKYGIVSGDNKYPGVARRFLWWPHDYSAKRFHKRVERYNDVFDICVRERFIQIVPTDRGEMVAKDINFDKMFGFPKLVHNLYEELNGFWKTLAWSVAMLLFLTGINGRDIVNWLLKIVRN